MAEGAVEFALTLLDAIERFSSGRVGGIVESKHWQLVRLPTHIAVYICRTCNKPVSSPVNEKTLHPMNGHVAEHLRSHEKVAATLPAARKRQRRAVAELLMCADGQRAATDLLVRWAAAKAVPTRALLDSHFRDFVEALHTGWHPPSSAQLQESLDRQVAAAVAVLRDELRHVDGYCRSLDSWSSYGRLAPRLYLRVASRTLSARASRARCCVDELMCCLPIAAGPVRRRFLAVHIHYIKGSELCERMVALEEVARLTRVDVHGILGRVAEKYGLAGKVVVATTTDGAEYDGLDTSIWCVDHKIHLALKSGACVRAMPGLLAFGAPKALVDKARRTPAHCSLALLALLGALPHALREFRECFGNSPFPEQVTLICTSIKRSPALLGALRALADKSLLLPVDTRWHSELSMLERCGRQLVAPVHLRVCAPR
jgi:hypothetical protein